MNDITWVLNVVKIPHDMIFFIPQFAIEEGGSEETLNNEIPRNTMVTIFLNGRSLQL